MNKFHCAWAALLLCIPWQTALAQTEPANVWQYSVPLEKNTERRAYLWIPPACRHVRGVMLGLQNMLERSMLEDSTIRGTLAETCMAIVWISPGAWPGKLDIPEQPSLKFEPQADAVAGVDFVLNALAKESGYVEIASAPLLVTGHSAASPFVWGLARALPNRVFAALPYKGYIVGAPAEGIPTLYVSQEWAEWGKTWGEVWRKEVAADLAIREKDPAVLLGNFVDLGAGHFDWHHESAGVLALFIAKSLKLHECRQHGSPQRCGTGVFVDPALLGTSGFHVNQEGKGLWYIDEEMAKAVSDSMRTALDKKPQAIDFTIDGQPAPLLSNGFAVLKPEFLPDGITFRVHAESLNQSPSTSLYAGAALGHADGPILYRVGSGALRQVGPDTFQVADTPGGLTRQGQPWEPWIIAYQPGDQQFRSTDKPAHMLVDVRNTLGSPQTISLPKLADVKANARPFAINAKATSGLPVQLFVESGPAVIEGNLLRLLPIPPGSKYPVRVIVSAFQWGRASGERVQTAGPETSEFFVVR